MLLNILGKPLLPDFFLEEDPEYLRQKIVEQGGKPAFGGQAKEPQGGATFQVFKQLESMVNEDLVKSVGGVFKFDLKGNTILSYSTIFILLYHCPIIHRCSSCCFVRFYNNL